jgi:hypothetical protein
MLTYPRQGHSCEHHEPAVGAHNANVRIGALLHSRDRASGDLVRLRRHPVMDLNGTVFTNDIVVTQL